MNKTRYARKSSLYRFNNQLGMRNLLRGIEYFRFYEWTFALKQMDLDIHNRVLDIGSGATSLLPSYLYSIGYEVNACDYDWEINEQKKIQGIVLDKGINGRGGKLKLHQQDATRLAFKNNTFQIVLAISVLEHFPGHGDTRAMEEIYRVLAPGGKLLITLPYRYGQYGEYDRTQLIDYFERVYDETALNERIIDVQGFIPIKKIYFGESPISFFNMWLKVPGHLRIMMGWTLIIPACVVIKETSAEKACGVALVMEKI